MSQVQVIKFCRSFPCLCVLMKFFFFFLRRYSNSYENLQPRVTKTLMKAFRDSGKPLSTHYGAIVGVTALGPQAIENVILPHFSTYLKAIEPQTSSTDSVKLKEARSCFEALMVRKYIWHPFCRMISWLFPFLTESCRRVHSRYFTEILAVKARRWNPDKREGNRRHQQRTVPL